MLLYGDTWEKFLSRTACQVRGIGEESDDSSGEE